MIQFVSASLTNFAIFGQTRIKFSTSDEKPLTVIRGENQSGKTTLLRGLLWVLFGSRAMPPASAVHNPIRPPGSREERIETRVTLRYRIQPSVGAPQEFVVSRVASTGATDGDVSRTFNERVEVSVVRDGAQEPVRFPDATLEQHFRPSMREFFFVDADQAVEYLGGPDSVADVTSMRRAVSHAINVLLALEQLRNAASRVLLRRSELTKELARRDRQNTASKNIAEEYEAALSRRKQLQHDRESAIFKAEEARAAFDRADTEFSKALGSTEQTSELYRRREEAQSKRTEAAAKRRQSAIELTEYLQSQGVITAILRPMFASLVDQLEPMKREGYIPMTERAIIARLLAKGRCLCGCDLSHNSIAADTLRSLQQQDEHLEVGSRILDQALEAARRSRDYSTGDPDAFSAIAIDRLLEAVAAADAAEYECAERVRKEEELIGEVGDVATALKQLQATRDSAAEVVRSQDEQCAELANALNALEPEIRSLEERIRINSNRNATTLRVRRHIDACSHIEAVLKAAYARIEQEQIGEVSAKMNELYRSITVATSDGFDGKVGVRALLGGSGQTRQYELFAEARDGTEKPLGMLNGASRRVLGIAFVLALADGAKSRIPLVVDSLLHATSGDVKRNLVRYLCDRRFVAQPILFGTYDDFLVEEVRNVTVDAAGATYTLTAQGHVRDGEGRGSVVSRGVGSSDLVALCSCSPAQYCNVCERHSMQQHRLVARH